MLVPPIMAAAKDGIFYGAEYSYYVKAAVSPEGLVLQSDKSVLNVFGDLIYLNDSPVLIAVNCIYYVLFVIVQNGTLRQHAVDIVCLYLRSRYYDCGYIYDTDQGQREDDAENYL